MTTALVICAALIFIAGLFAVIVERTQERDEAMEIAERLEAECNVHAAVSASLAAQLAEAQIAGGKVIPFPRSPIHDDLAVEQLRAELNDEWFQRLHGWGDDLA